ncbi:hybrid sensor histidine kinase/response regulator [Desulfomonile tiedjei]|uniref:histidine kinase n=1 Tax=Desulfomonile tiedjei (strain ATCC 49306 / DSM 6799 / DCB-1) TaxID=706587 RepID=I4C4K0_DESTA|nr:ATP-binding protein [Desulfomonile tiedjei]AFM24491.1 PAS domain S-box [Desulfomonile tiedjei DSM 6799]
MTKDKSQFPEEISNSTNAAQLGLLTETIEINGQFPNQLTESGSFDLTGFRLTSLGKLLSALPMPALVVDGSFSIVFANESSEKLGDTTTKLVSAPFSSLFPRSRDAAAFQGILEKVFTIRKLQVSEGLVEIGTNRMWGRLNFRSLRLGKTRLILVLIEDLTLEKKQVLLIETSKEIMRQAKEKYERQFHEQTAELKLTNERLRQEIEERSKTQSALEKSRDSFNSIVERSSDGIAILDCEGTILYVNRAAALFLGKTPESLRGERLAIALGPGQIAETSIVRPNGQPGTAEIQLSRTQWDGKPSFLIVFRDITDRKRTEQELQRSQKLETLELIAGGLAHDFNNLLTANIANISLAKIRSNRESPVYDALTRAERASTKARELTRQLLTFAKGRPLIKKPTLLTPLLQEAAVLALSGSNVKFRLRVGENLWPAEIEPYQIGTVFQNLIINAKQAMPEGGLVLIKAENLVVGAEPRPDESQSPRGRYVRIMIKDTGSGISEQNLAKIFDPYFTTKAAGSGLGLATSYAVVKKHGGRIEVESREGSGTSFFIYLPASDRSAEPVENSDRAPYRGSGNILIMDDEEDIRDAAKDLLSILGYTVETAENGTRAIAKYQKAMRSGDPFDVVIMDLTVPGGMGGREATRRLLEIDQNAKIILSSGHLDEPIMIDFQHYGLVGVIAKPYNALELGDILRKVTGSKASSQD